MIASRASFLVFLSLWFSYLLLYFLRKPIGIIKTNLETEYDFQKFQIGLLDSAFLLPYSLSQILFINAVSGYDSISFLLFSMLLAAISTMGLGYVTTTFLPFFIMLFLNGFFQGFYWPIAIKVISNLYGKSPNLNFILGLYGTCAFAGGTLGTLLAVYIRDKYNWHLIYPITSLIIIIYVIVFLILYECIKKHIHPHLGLISNPSSVNTKKINKSQNTITPKQKSIFKDGLGTSLMRIPVIIWERSLHTIQIFRTIPLVFDVSLSMFCVKTIRYILYMWLPMLLEQQSGYTSTKAGNMSAMFEIGGLMGSMVLGFALDRYYRNTQMKGIYYFLVGHCATIFVFWWCTQSSEIPSIFTAGVLVFLGLFLGGLDNMMGSCVPLYIIQCWEDDMSKKSMTSLQNGGENTSLISPHQKHQENQLLLINGNKNDVVTIEKEIDIVTNKLKINGDEKPIIMEKSAIIGLINGMGCFGTFIEGPLIGYILVSGGSGTTKHGGSNVDDTIESKLNEKQLDLTHHQEWFKFYLLLIVLAILPLVKCLSTRSTRQKIFAQ